MEFTFVPTAIIGWTGRACSQRQTLTKSRRWRVDFRRWMQVDRDFVMTALLGNFIKAEKDIPLTCLDWPCDVAGRGFIRGDKKFEALAAAPTAKTLTHEISAARVEDADVHDVPARNFGVRRDRRIVGIDHINTVDLCGYL